MWSNCEPQRRCARVGRRGARGAVPFGARHAQHSSASFGVQFVKSGRGARRQLETDAMEHNAQRAHSPLLRIYVGECDGGAWRCARCAPPRGISKRKAAEGASGLSGKLQASCS